MIALSHVFSLSGFDVRIVDTNNASLQVRATSTATHAACPDCAATSAHIHSHYCRPLADLPCSGRAVTVTLHLRRFYCRNHGCQRVTFVERVPLLAAPYARRTTRLTELQQLLGLALGGEAGARSAARLGMGTSPDTLLRLIRQLPEPVAAIPSALGIDEWAWRKGRRYGTILCDLQTHRPIDLLPDDSAETITAWLHAHPGIEIISRDRSGPFAMAATAGAPHATQVADRWHILQNLADTLKRVFERNRAVLEPVRAPCRELPEASRTVHAAGTEAPSAHGRTRHADQPAPPAPSAEALRAERRGQRQERYAEVHRLRAIGMSQRQIAQRVGISTKTVHRWLHAAAYPAHPGAKRRGRPYGSHLDPYKPYLVTRFQEGCQNACALYREIQQQGYPGSRSLVRKFITWVRNLEGLEGEGTLLRTKPQPQYSIPDVVFAVLRRPDKRSVEQQEIVVRLAAVGDPIRIACDLTQTFARIIRDQQSEEFTQWLEQAETSGGPEFRTLVIGLRRDEAAVGAALSLPWNNGPTEGNINRLKLIKRSMYGRGNFDLLRKRMLHAA